MHARVHVGSRHADNCAHKYFEAMNSIGNDHFRNVQDFLAFYSSSHTKINLHRH